MDFSIDPSWHPSIIHQLEDLKLEFEVCAFHSKLFFVMILTVSFLRMAKSHRKVISSGETRSYPCSTKSMKVEAIHWTRREACPLIQATTLGASLRAPVASKIRYGFLFLLRLCIQKKILIIALWCTDSLQRPWIWPFLCENLFNETSWGSQFFWIWIWVGRNGKLKLLLECTWFLCWIISNNWSATRVLPKSVWRRTAASKSL